MKQSEKAIGVFDSGVGGLTVVRKLVDILPNERILYLGDTARVPYGNKTRSTVQLYAEQCATFLLEHSVKLIIVACNTASALALEEVRALSPVPVIGMITPGASAGLRYSKSGKIGVIGTRATIESNAYQEEILRLAGTNNISIHTNPCPLFVPLVEEGWHSHPATTMIATEYLAPLREQGVDSLILGCTHYPMLKDVIGELMPNVRLIDSGEESAAIAKDILLELGEHSPFKNNTLHVDCYVTDKPRNFSHIAQRFLGFPLPAAKQVSIEELHRYPVSSKLT